MEYSDLYVRRIRQLCKERGIAINKLATMSGINQSTIDNIVRGLTKNPRVMTLHKIAIAFNMTVAEFLDFKELNDCLYGRMIRHITIINVIGDWHSIRCHTVQDSILAAACSEGRLSRVSLFSVFPVPVLT